MLSLTANRRRHGASCSWCSRPPPAPGRGPRPGPVLAGFHLGDNPYAGGQHRGIDIGGAAGSPVLAPRGGTVTFAGAVATSGLSVAIATAGRVLRHARPPRLDRRPPQCPGRRGRRGRDDRPDRGAPRIPSRTSSSACASAPIRTATSIRWASSRHGPARLRPRPSRRLRLLRRPRRRLRARPPRSRPRPAGRQPRPSPKPRRLRRPRRRRPSPSPSPPRRPPRRRLRSRQRRRPAPTPSRSRPTHPG